MPRRIQLAGRAPTEAANCQANSGIGRVFSRSGILRTRRTRNQGKDVTQDATQGSNLFPVADGDFLNPGAQLVAAK